MARVNKVNTYLIERLAFNVWWNVAQCANPGDAHLVAKALRDSTSKTHRVMKNYGEEGRAIMAQYDAEPASWEKMKNA